MYKDPASLVHGLTKEQVESDPEIAEFFRANYPEAYEPRPDRQPTTVGDNVEPDQSVLGSAVAKPEAINYPLNIRPLQCYLRDDVHEEGSRRSQRLREVGEIPGILYGSDPTLGIYSHSPESKTLVKTEWKYLQRELDRYHRSFESRVYDLTVYEDPEDTEGTVHRVVPRNVQRHPVQSTIYCANYCRYHAGRPLMIPITYINEEESPALKRDGYIIPIKKFIECFVEEGLAIPDHLELECTGLQVKDVIRMDRMNIPDGIRISDRVKKRGDDFIIGVVQGKRGTDD